MGLVTLSSAHHTSHTMGGLMVDWASRHGVGEDTKKINGIIGLADFCRRVDAMQC